jgi:hypothetical protein
MRKALTTIFLALSALTVGQTEAWFWKKPASSAAPVPSSQPQLQPASSAPKPVQPNSPKKP